MAGTYGHRRNRDCRFIPHKSPDAVSRGSGCGSVASYRASSGTRALVRRLARLRRVVSRSASKTASGFSLIIGAVLALVGVRRFGVLGAPLALSRVHFLGVGLVHLAPPRVQRFGVAMTGASVSAIDSMATASAS
jgi:hypothetical protein